MDTNGVDVVIVSTEPAARCKTGDIRVVGGANSSEGRVEVCLNGHWGKVSLWCAACFFHKSLLLISSVSHFH